MTHFYNVREEQTPNGPRFYPLVRADNLKITLRACLTGEEAEKVAAEARRRLDNGETTVQELRDWRKIKAGGKVRTVTEWAKKLGVSRQSLHSQAKYHGRTVEEEIRLRVEGIPT